MKPILLKGHERSITMARYNRDGDLIFTCSKDGTPSVWYSDNGERLGTYQGHVGAVWCVDCSYDSSLVVTGSADTEAKVWNTFTGENLISFVHKGAVRGVAFSDDSRLIATISDQFSSNPPEICVFEIADNAEQQDVKPCLVFSRDSLGFVGKITGVYWLPLNKAILATGEDGTIKIFNPWADELEILHDINAHEDRINSLQFNTKKTLFVTSSSDHNAHLYDAVTLEHLKTFKTDRPVNDAAISAGKLHVFLGGGQDAMDVTTTSTRVGNFETRMYNLVTETEFGRVKGHFGPINTLAIHPSGKSFISGAEDGYVRLHKLDDSYHKPTEGDEYPEDLL